MKILDVPYTNLIDMKKSPQAAFDKARTTNTGVYVLKDDKPFGVVLTCEHYEELNAEISALHDKIDEMTVRVRLADMNVKTYTEKEVLGDKLKNVTVDDNDGWE